MAITRADLEQRPDPGARARYLIREGALKKTATPKTKRADRHTPNDVTVTCTFCDPEEAWSATWHGTNGGEPIAAAFAQHVQSVPLKHFLKGEKDGLREKER